MLQNGHPMHPKDQSGRGYVILVNGFNHGAGLNRQFLEKPILLDKIMLVKMQPELQIRQDVQ
jgi:hypothetical protein